MVEEAAHARKLAFTPEAKLDAEELEADFFCEAYELGHALGVLGRFCRDALLAFVDLIREMAGDLLLVAPLVNLEVAVLNRVVSIVLVRHESIN